MKYCARCGAELHDEAVICTKCGCPVDAMRSPYDNYASNKWNGLAIAGFVLSFFNTLIGLILSIIAYKQVKESGEKGKELALAGIIICCVTMVIGIILFIFYFQILFTLLMGLSLSVA